VSQALSSPNADDGTLSGRVLSGRYRVESPIAEGGMASVHVGTDLESGGRVAVKVMHAHLTRDRGFARRFKREAAIAGRLRHPSIVQVIDHGVDGHLFFLVMELLDGMDVFDVLRQRQRLDEALARRVVIEVCDALTVAHAQGIVHRDLKPENVFLCRTPDEGIVVKVLDFGVAKMVLPDDTAPNADEAETALTAMGTLLGTPEYLSPEMCRGEAVGPAADVYACGVLLYALLTGRPPFVTERPIDTATKHISEEPLPPSWFAPGLDARLDAIILRALAKQPAGRQPSARALSEALLELGPTEPLPASLLGAAPPARHAPDAPTLAVPNAALAKPVARAPDAPAEPAPVRVSLPPREQLASAPPTVRGGASTPSGAIAARAAIAAAVLALTFAAGFAAGRMSAPAASPPSPSVR
jgi:serine/threonine-protein kinase